MKKALNFLRSLQRLLLNPGQRSDKVILKIIEKGFLTDSMGDYVEGIDEIMDDILRMYDEAEGSQEDRITQVVASQFDYVEKVKTPKANNELNRKAAVRGTGFTIPVFDLLVS